MRPFWCFIVNLEHISHFFSGASIVDCEHVNDSRGFRSPKIQNYCVFAIHTILESIEKILKVNGSMKKENGLVKIYKKNNDTR